MKKLSQLILVTGANGYVAGCLIPKLLEEGHRIRCLVRDPSRIDGRAWRAKVEVFQGDINQPENLKDALQGVTTAYYLIHNMSSGSNYYQRELSAAENFGCAARSAGLKHIIYLGGLANPKDNIGMHMRSRLQTGELLRQCGVPVTEFRASLIIGPGSISFEMIRFLSEQLFLLVGPRWFRNHTQPIAIQNVLDYLLAVLESPEYWGKIYEIGGTDVITYAETIYAYAHLRGLTRTLLIVPTIPIRLMASIVGMLTPVSATIAAPLIGGMQSDSIVRDNSTTIDFPQIKPIGYRAAVLSALKQLTPDHLEVNCDGDIFQARKKTKGFFTECNGLLVNTTADKLYQTINNLGGKQGWLYWDVLWRFRGWLDRLIGGPGMRGRKSGKSLAIGDIVDFYRVEVVEPGRRLRLKAELKAPGEGWMEWRVEQRSPHKVLLIQLVYFAPKGVPGFLYWYLLHPIHRLVFTGLIHKITQVG